MTLEKRSNIRTAVKLPVRWEGTSGLQETHVEDIGLGGCFVSTRGKVNVGSPIVLQVQLFNRDWMPVRGQVVTYHPGIGFGVVFWPLTSREKSSLRFVIPNYRVACV